MGARTAEGPRRGVRGRSAVPTAPISSWSTASLFKALSMAAAALSHCPGGRGGGVPGGSSRPLLPRVTRKAQGVPARCSHSRRERQVLGQLCSARGLPEVPRPLWAAGKALLLVSASWESPPVPPPAGEQARPAGRGWGLLPLRARPSGSRLPTKVVFS